MPLPEDYAQPSTSEASRLRERVRELEDAITAIVISAKFQTVYITDLSRALVRTGALTSKYFAHDRTTALSWQGEPTKEDR